MTKSEMLYVIGIPFLYFSLDLIMRLIMYGREFGWEDACYGPDLSLTGITTGFAFLPDIADKSPDWKLVAGVFTVSLVTVFGTIGLHCGCLQMLKSKNIGVVWFGRLVLFGVGNIAGIVGMSAVLLLMWKK